MTEPKAIAGSAIVTALASALVASVVISVMTPEAARTEPQNLYDTAPSFRLSPIPAGADWGRS
jgi:hypothetical protein